ncbi:MAG: hypothetical protein DHS20C19_26480 [Acidimicrobiales bacterium]|nr:MAG: hypothetical protein DHS20C19_26480 [Acidimicrobiales bacterium]
MPREMDDPTAEAADTARIRAILSDLEDADFERLDPPADVWTGIEAAVASGAARSSKVPPSRDVTAGTVVEYSIDADDRVVGVGESWAAFARDNDAPELGILPPDRTIWSYFEGDEVTELWRLLVERVRTLQRPARVPLRCDAPAARRWFDMSISPESDGGVQFRCVMVFEEARPAVSLLDTHADRDSELAAVALCSWCARAQHGARWLDLEELVAELHLLERSSMPSIAHGICASCREEMSAELLVPARSSDASA